MQPTRQTSDSQLHCWHMGRSASCIGTRQFTRSLNVRRRIVPNVVQHATNMNSAVNLHDLLPDDAEQPHDQPLCCLQHLQKTWPSYKHPRATREVPTCCCCCCSSRVHAPIIFGVLDLHPVKPHVKQHLQTFLLILCQLRLQPSQPVFWCLPKVVGIPLEDH